MHLVFSYTRSFSRSTFSVVTKGTFNHSPYPKSSFPSSRGQLLHTSSVDMTKALVLGAYTSKEDASQDQAAIFTETAAHFDKNLGGKLHKLVADFGPRKKGKSKTFYNLHSDFPVVSVVGLGSQDAKYNEAEEIDEKRENVRVAIAVAAKSVRDELGVDEILVDPCGDAEAAAEAANLALWSFDELKSEKYKKKVVKINIYQPVANDVVLKAFQTGTCLAETQNICRRLSDLPASHLTPTIFSKTIQDMFNGVPNTKVIVHDRQWAQDKKMNSFLSVAKGSAEEPKFVEIHYNNKPKSKPFVLVGKGICFDSGGISLKPGLNMDKMRYDMSGAANVVTTTLALAKLRQEVNVIALAPLCENMPSGTANRPGDVVVAMNGKSIQIDNTDAEGRLILADALTYAHEFEPQAILDIATLTGAMRIALGSAVTGVFSSSTSLFDGLHRAGTHTGDRVWRCPLFSHYRSQVVDSALADCLNIGKQAAMGGACTAAAFLSEFVECPNWMHLDIAGVADSKDDCPYYGNNMTGRPMRTLYYFLAEYFKTK